MNLKSGILEINELSKSLYDVLLCIKINLFSK